MPLETLSPKIVDVEDTYYNLITGAGHMKGMKAILIQERPFLEWQKAWSHCEKLLRTISISFQASSESSPWGSESEECDVYE